jgi:hypothetical protein
MWTGGIQRDNIIMEFGGDTDQEAKEEYYSLRDACLLTGRMGYPTSSVPLEE